METDSWDFEIEIHPEALRRLGEMELSAAKSFLRISGWFNSIEIELLTEKAGCCVATWTPYKEGKYRNPFLICDEHS